MSAASPDSAILDYIRANRGTFSREEIVRELRLAGHEDAAITAAWAAIAAEEPTTPLTAELVEPQASVTEQVAVAEPGPSVEPGPFVGRDPAIDHYIRENRATYTRPAVTTSLLEAGHSREEIEAAWAESAAADARPQLVPGVVSQRRAALGTWEFWVTAIVTFVGLLVLPYALVIVFVNQDFTPAAGCVPMIGAVAAGLILLAFEKTRNAGLGCLAGVGALFALSIVLAIIGFILVLIIAGICLVAFSQSGTTP